MESESEDFDDIFITQNTFSQPEIPDFGGGLLDEILGRDNDLEQQKQEVGESFEKQSPKRNIVLVADEQLNERKESRIPKATKSNTAWAINCWRGWANERNEAVGSSTDKYTQVNSDILQVNDEELNYWLSKMVVEIRKKKTPGEVYPPLTLYQLCCGLQRFLKDNGRPEIDIFSSPKFKHFQDCLDAEIKRLTSLGVGLEVKEAEAFSEDQLQSLLDNGILSDSSPQVLLDNLLFLIGQKFTLRSGKEHRELRFSQFKVVPANDKEGEKLVYTSFGEKNNAGGLKTKRVRQKKVEHYAREELGTRCVVKLFKRYISKCPKLAIENDRAFYLAPLKSWKRDDDVWFTNNPVGHNLLSSTVKRVCQKGKIEGHYTNHSLRATTATIALKKGIPEKFVMQRTGHRDVRSLQRYQRPGIVEKVKVSNSFDFEQEVERPEAEPQVEPKAKKCKIEREAETEQTSKVVYNNCLFHINYN